VEAGVATLANSAYGEVEGPDLTVNRTSQTLHVAGALDVTTVGHFRPVAEELLREGCQQLVLDISGLRLIDSVGIGVIIYLYRQLRARGGSLDLQGASGQPLAILKLMKLEQILMLTSATAAPPP
jgi:anti-sigma B factor antagonist